jgi:Peptidase MA superfamily
MRGILAFFVLPVCCGVAQLAGAASHAPDLLVAAPPQLAGAAARVRALAPQGFAAAFALTGTTGPGSPIKVVLAPADSPLARHAPSWVSGYAIPASSLIVIFPTRVPSYPDDNLASLLHHEVTHVLESRACGFRPLPRWFDEGLATVAAREWGLEDRARYALAVIGRGPDSIAGLDAAFLGDAAEVARAYALSAALMRLLVDRFGATFPARLLALVGRGVPFDEAFRTASGVGLSEIERDFFHKEAFWYTWVPFATSSAALWMGITFLALLAIKRRRDRDAEMRARWQQEDRAWQVPRTTTEPPDVEDDPWRYN